MGMLDRNREFGENFHYQLKSSRSCVNFGDLHYTETTIDLLSLPIKQFYRIVIDREGESLGSTALVARFAIVAIA